MSDEPHMEDKILSTKPKRRYITVASVLVVVGLILTTFGYMINKNSVSADTATATTTATSSDVSVTPPTPNDPSLNPLSPDDPTTPGTFTFAKGWSMISGRALRGYNLTELNNAGIMLYSFNDPDYPTTDWVIFPGTIDVSTLTSATATTTATATNKTVSLNPVVPLGYYAYNPGDARTITLAATTPSTNDIQMFGRGWHLFYWGGSTSMTKSEILGRIKLTYSDGTVITGAQAASSDLHRASVAVYVVVDETNIDLSSSVKQLTDADTDTTVSKLPKKSYYWLYLRRTKDRVSSVNYTVSASSTATDVTPVTPSEPTE